jgi:hypothetical protein
VTADQPRLQARPPVRPRRYQTERERQEQIAADPWRRLRARAAAVSTFVLAAVLPVVLWHDVLVGTASEFRLNLNYLVSQWLCWALMAGGLAFYAPVVVSSGSDPESRWYPRARGAYAGWGITLYLLGLALATQVAQIYALHAG